MPERHATQSDVQNLGDKIDVLSQDVHDLTVAINGPPGNGHNPGLMTRVALLENSAKGMKWRYRLLVGTAVAATFAIVADVCVTVLVK